MNTMKTNLPAIFFAAILSLNSTLSLSAENLSLITGENKIVTEWWNWDDASKWFPTVSEVAGNNLSVDINNGDVELSSTIPSGFSAGNVSIKVKNNKNHVYFNAEGNTTFSSLSVRQLSEGYYGVYIGVLNGSTLTVNGDVDISPLGAYNSNAVTFGCNRWGNNKDYDGGFHILGNLNISANISDTWFNANFNTTATSFIVDGIVNMTERQGERQYGVIWTIQSETTRIGGLQGSNLYGKNKLLTEGDDRTLTFTNKAGTAANWSGAVVNNGKNLNIVMDESAKGSQDIDITEGAINNISVKGGSFYISSASDVTGTLLIDGGFYNAKGDGAKFAAIDLASGGFIFEAGALENGYKISAGEVSKSGTEKIVVDFNGLYAPDYYGYEFVLISADAVDGTIDLENAGGDFTAANLYEGNAVFKWAENGGKYELSATFSKIPEPSGIAALFGAAALFFVFRRKRA